MKNDTLQKLIQKYIEGDCTHEEITAVHEWYNSFEHDQDPIETLSSEQKNKLKQRLISGIRSKIAYQNTEPVKLNTRKHISRTLQYSLSAIAATIILAIGLVLYINSNNSVAPSYGNLVVINGTKSIRKTILPDGSIVWLNPQSRVKYPKIFKAGKREIQMSGEAFFEVTRDVKRPFLIYTGNVITRVLGTSFRVRAYKNIPVDVSVVTGKVSVRLRNEKHSEVTLLPNQKATYVNRSNLLKKDIENQTSGMRIWQKATMSFDNETLEKIIKTLNKQFGVYITSSDENLLHYTLKADFTDQSLPSIFQMLEKSLNIEYEINDKRIILNAKTN